MNAPKASQMSMQDIKSLNFEPLRAAYPELANMGGYAEHYAHSDPESALVKLRNFAERLVDRLYLKLKLERVPQSNFVDLLHNAGFRISYTCCVAWVTGVRTAKMLRRRTPFVVFKRLGSSPDGPM
jgi:tRNA G26 N,N-dimethylase Trm1